MNRILADNAVIAAERLQQPLTTPRLGEPVVINQELPREKWWLALGSSK